MLKTDALPKPLMDLGRYPTFLNVNRPKRKVFRGWEHINDSKVFNLQNISNPSQKGNFLNVTKLGGGLIDPKLPKTKKSKCYQTFLGAVLCIKAGENFEFGEWWHLTPCTWGLKIWKSPLKIEISKLFYYRHVGCLSRGIEGTRSKITFFLFFL